MTPALSTTGAAPPHARSVPLDALRGFALLGIVLVNAPFFAGPIGTKAPEAWPDFLAAWFIGAFAAGKFFLMFSFLFGFGFSRVLARADRNAKEAGPRFRRRLLCLFVFGALHAAFLFIGDILMLYALLGLVLWQIRDWPTDRLLATGLGLCVAGALLQAFIVAVTSQLPPELIGVGSGAGYLGGFWQAAAQRWRELPEGLATILLFNGLPALAMFMLGYALGRRGDFPPSPGRIDSLRRPIAFSLVGGVVVSGCAMAVLLVAGGRMSQFSAIILLCLVGPILSFGMAGSAYRLFARHAEARPVRWLAMAGGCSLTGYILHSVLFCLIFHGYGLGLYGSLGTGAVLLIGLAVFVVLVVALNLWRQWFRYGPDEWLLRSFVDFEWKPMRERKAMPTHRSDQVA